MRNKKNRIDYTSEKKYLKKKTQLEEEILCSLALL